MNNRLILAIDYTMNIITQVKKKGTSVIKFLLILITVISCKSQQNTVNDDYLILNKIINITIKNKDDFKIKLSNDNNYVISIIKKFKSLEKSKNKLNTEKLSLGIENNSVTNYIFNKRQYDHFILQKEHTKWNFDKSTIVNEKNILKGDSFFMKSKEIFISKPIYTLNKKYALVRINKSTILYIMILHKRDNKWFKMDNIAFHIK